MYIRTKELGAVSLWAFLHFVILLRTDRGGPQQRIGNISRPAAAETCPPGRAKMEKVLGTKSHFRHEKTPKVTLKYTKAFFQNYEIVTKCRKKNGISKLATFS